MFGIMHEFLLIMCSYIATEKLINGHYYCFVSDLLNVSLLTHVVSSKMFIIVQ